MTRTRLCQNQPGRHGNRPSYMNAGARGRALDGNNGGQRHFFVCSLPHLRPRRVKSPRPDTAGAKKKPKNAASRRNPRRRDAPFVFCGRLLQMILITLSK